MKTEHSKLVRALSTFSVAAKRRLDAFWAAEDVKYKKNKFAYVNRSFLFFVAFFSALAIVAAIAI